MLNAAFLAEVECLRAPLSGTEQMGPLLYTLIRFARPRSVIEVGMGYTTPFILQALADNESDFEREKVEMLTKTREVFKNPDDASAQETWFMSPPLGGNPAHYLQPYGGHLYAFDDFSAQYSSAPRVLEVVRKLGLDGILSPVKEMANGRSSRIAERHRPVDLAWNDAADYHEFFEEYWPLINPEGGMMAFHNTVNACPKAAMFVKDLKLRQASQPCDFELVSFLEPHKMNQNSFTLLRKITRFRDRIMSWEQDRIRADARKLLEAAKNE